MLVQETAAAQARMLLPPLERQLDQQRHLLATLTGHFPSEATAATFQLGSFRLPRQLPLSLPADLVCQRPDVRAAEANVHAANAQIGVAIANRLPQITLSGNDGSTALAISKLFSPGTSAWTIAGNALQPVFDGGTLRYKQQGAEEAWVQSVAQYRSTVLVAFQNVADTLRALQADARALNAAVAAEQAAPAQLRSRAPATRAGSSEPADPAQRSAGLFADIVGARTSRGRAPRRHRRLVPGAGRRLVEQVGSYDHASGLG